MDRIIEREEITKDDLKCVQAMEHEIASLKDKLKAAKEVIKDDVEKISRRNSQIADLRGQVKRIKEEIASHKELEGILDNWERD